MPTAPSGRYDEARTTAVQAVKLGIETTPTRRLLYQIGLVLGDGTADAHLIWAKGKPREFDLVSAQAQAASFRGRLQECARSLSAVDRHGGGARAERDGVRIRRASRIDRGALPQRSATTRRSIRATLGRIESEADAPGTVPRFRAGIAFGLAGLTTEAQALIAQAQQRYPESTFIKTLLTPATRAAIALQRRQPEQAIAALEATAPTEAGTVAGLLPFYLRGEAYLQKQSYTEAGRQFERILKLRGVDPMSPIVALAHLGLARARAGAGDADGARRGYEDLFEIWQNADADFPPLLAARAEYAAY